MKKFGLKIRKRLLSLLSLWIRMINREYNFIVLTITPCPLKSHLWPFPELELFNVQIFSFRLLAEYFANYFLYSNSFLFIIYAHDSWDQARHGVKKSQQRWQQCHNSVFHFDMKPALEFLYASRFYDKEIVKSVEKLASEAIEFVIQKIENDESLDETIKEEAIEYLREINIEAGVPRELLNDKKLDEFYDELQLKSDKNYVKTFFETQKYSGKIKLEPKKSWRRKENEKTTNFGVKYYSDGNLLCKKSDFEVIKIVIISRFFRHSFSLDYLSLVSPRTSSFI
jgi:hypothetical protein